MDEFDNQERLFRIPFIKLPNSAALRSLGVYAAGALYAIGIWLFADAVIYSRTLNASKVHVTFVDWLPFILSTLGMFVVNSIDKSRLLNDAFGGSSSFTGSSTTTWQARVILFLGFAMLAGGLSGSVVVLILKYLVHGYTYPTLGMGVNQVLANGSVMMSTFVLWVAQNIQDEYSYSLAL